MNIGDYVRTKNKIIKVGEEELYNINLDSIKSSPNIIDLIEVGDIIKGKDNHLFEVYAIGNDCVYINNLEEFVLINEIKSILTREMFESMEYKIGE